MNELIKMQNVQGIATVNARDLHEFLIVESKFADWIKNRIEQYGFAEKVDYVIVSSSGNNPKGGRPEIDYHLSVDMAKQLSMLENGEKGKEFRRYFISMEQIALKLYADIQLLESKKQEKLQIRYDDICGKYSYLHDIKSPVIAIEQAIKAFSVQHKIKIDTIYRTIINEYRKNGGVDLLMVSRQKLKKVPTARQILEWCENNKKIDDFLNIAEIVMGNFEFYNQGGFVVDGIDPIKYED